MADRMETVGREKVPGSTSTMSTKSTICRSIGPLRGCSGRCGDRYADFFSIDLLKEDRFYTSTRIADSGEISSIEAKISQKEENEKG